MRITKKLERPIARPRKGRPRETTTEMSKYKTWEISRHDRITEFTHYATGKKYTKREISYMAWNEGKTLHADTLPDLKKMIDHKTSGGPRSAGIGKRRK